VRRDIPTTAAMLVPQIRFVVADALIVDRSFTVASPLNDGDTLR
jgi:hypothetical protein